MSILVVWSSPNTDGLTAAAKNKVIEGILESGKEVEEIHLNCKKSTIVRPVETAGENVCPTANAY